MGAELFCCAPGDAATLNSKVVHTFIIGQQATQAGLTPVTGTKPEAIHSGALFA